MCVCVCVFVCVCMHVLGAPAGSHHIGARESPCRNKGNDPITNKVRSAGGPTNRFTPEQSNPGTATLLLQGGVEGETENRVGRGLL